MAQTKLLPGTGAKVARFVVIFLAIELVPFIAIYLVYHTPVAALTFAYVIVGLPALMQIPVYGLWQLDVRGASPRLLAVCWFWLMQLMTTAVVIGLLVGGHTIHVITRDEAIWGFTIWQMLMAPVDFFAGYLSVLAMKTSQREAG